MDKGGNFFLSYGAEDLYDFSSYKPTPIRPQTSVNVIQLNDETR